MEQYFVKKALRELRSPTLESTKDSISLLGSHSNIDGNNYEIYDSEDNIYTVVSFPVLKNRIFLNVYIERKSDEIDEVILSSSNEVYLVASSKSHSLLELEEITQLYSTDGWSVGEERDKRIMNFTSFKIRQPLSTQNKEMKIKKLIFFLMDNKESLERLLDICDKVQMKIVTWSYYDQLEGLALSQNIISSICSLKLSLDVENYIVTDRPIP